MPRYFNTAGPRSPARNYTLPTLTRLPSVRDLIDQSLYFALHASSPSLPTSPAKAPTPPFSSPWNLAPPSPATWARLKIISLPPALESR